MKISITILLIFGTVFLSEVFAQVDKLSPRINISYYRKGDDIPTVKVRVQKRIERRFYPMKGVVVEAYFNSESEEYYMGNAETDSKGEGSIEIPIRLMSEWHDLNAFSFIAVMNASDSTEYASENQEIVKSRLTLTAGEDSTITALLVRKTDSVWMPEPEVEVKFYIKRFFGDILVTDDYLETEEDGSISMKFDDEVPGNEKGELTLIAKVQDHDEFGNLEAYRLTNWGVPTIDDNTRFEERSLWSTRSHAPYWLLILANTIIFTVWGVILYLVLLVFKIKKLSHSN
jgi:hypothetical protein